MAKSPTSSVVYRASPDVDSWPSRLRAAGVIVRAGRPAFCVTTRAERVATLGFLAAPGVDRARVRATCDAMVIAACMLVSCFGRKDQRAPRVISGASRAVILASATEIISSSSTLNPGAQRRALAPGTSRGGRCRRDPRSHVERIPARAADGGQGAAHHLARRDRGGTLAQGGSKSMSQLRPAVHGGLLRRLHLPPHHQGLHDPDGRSHGHGARRRVHLRRTLQGRTPLADQVQPSRATRDGQRGRPRHQRQPVLHHPRANRLDRPQAHNLRQGHRTHHLQRPADRRPRGGRRSTRGALPEDPQGGDRVEPLRRHRPAGHQEAGRRRGRRGTRGREEEKEEGEEEAQPAVLRRGSRRGGGGAREDGKAESQVRLRRRRRGARRTHRQAGICRGGRGARRGRDGAGADQGVPRTDARQTRGEGGGGGGTRGRRRRRRAGRLRAAHAGEGGVDAGAVRGCRRARRRGGCGRG